jgi:hypothetical protein
VTSYSHDAGDDKDAHNTSGGSVESLETIGQGVEVLHIEAPRLVQPNEVVVSSTVCIEKLDPVATPAGKRITEANYAFDFAGCTDSGLFPFRKIL